MNDIMHRVEKLEKIANGLRIDVVKMIYNAQSGHPGGSLSAADIVTALYFDVMKHNPKKPSDPNRDRFILSKGHAAPILYAALAKAGYFDSKLLSTLRKLGSPLQGHPDKKKLEGVEASTGSLGHGIGNAVGMAMALKFDKSSSRVFCMLGDGEIEEGSVWESFMAASHYKLDNLTAIVDNNGLQIDGKVCDVMNVSPIIDKLESFGFDTVSIDGHDFHQILQALDRKPNGKPLGIVAHTVKGKGVSYMENNVAFHGKPPDNDEFKKALEELSL